MKNATITLVTFLLVVSFGAPLALAKEDKEGHGKPSFLETTSEENERESKEERYQEDKKLKVKLREEAFDIDGVISSLSETSFVIGEDTIFIDPSQVASFRQKGVLEVGQRVKVRGVESEGVLYAKDINVIGTGQGKLQVWFRNLLPGGDTPEPTTSPEPTTTPDPTDMPEPTISPDPSATPSATLDPTATPSATPESSPLPEEGIENGWISIKVSGLVSDVKDFLAQILSYL